LCFVTGFLTEKPGVVVLISCYQEVLTIGKVVADFWRELPSAHIYSVLHFEKRGACPQVSNGFCGKLGKQVAVNAIDDLSWRS